MILKIFSGESIFWPITKFISNHVKILQWRIFESYKHLQVVNMFETAILSDFEIMSSVLALDRKDCAGPSLFNTHLLFYNVAY